MLGHSLQQISWSGNQSFKPTSCASPLADAAWLAMLQSVAQVLLATSAL
jgi:hypothetical protein